jgi:hypothetical protein
MIFDCKPERHRRVRCIWFVSSHVSLLLSLEDSCTCASACPRARQAAETFRGTTGASEQPFAVKMTGQIGKRPARDLCLLCRLGKTFCFVAERNRQRRPPSRCSGCSATLPGRKVSARYQPPFTDAIHFRRANDRTQPRRSDDGNRESGTECANRR